MAEENGAAEFYTVSYRPYDGGGEKDALLAAARREFFMEGRASGRARGVEDGLPVRTRYKLARGRFLWKKTSGKAVLQEAFPMRGGGWRLVTHGAGGELRSAAVYDAGLRWLRTAYYSGDPARPAAVLRREDGSLLLTERAAGGRTAARLLPCPADPGSAAQSYVNGRAGEPEVLARTDRGTLCFCRGEERALRLRLLERLACDPALLSPAWPSEGEAPALDFKVIPNAAGAAAKPAAEPLSRFAGQGPRETVPGPRPGGGFSPVEVKPVPAEGSYAAHREIYIGEGGGGKYAVAAAKPPSRFAGQGPRETAPPTQTAEIGAAGKGSAKQASPEDAARPPKYVVAAKGLSGAAKPSSHFAAAKPPSRFAGQGPRETAPEPQAAEGRSREIPQTVPPEETENRQNPNGGPKQALPEDAARPPKYAVAAKGLSGGTRFAGKETRETAPPAQTAEIGAAGKGSAEQSPESAAGDAEKETPPGTETSVHMKESREIPKTVPPKEAENQQNPNGGPCAQAQPAALIPAKRIVVSSMESYLYFGRLINGLREGRGRTQSADGKTAYEGGYRADLRDGFGVYYYKSGRLCYAGGWKRNLRDGMGVAFGSRDGSIFVGRWKDGVATGRGSAFDMDGNLTYTGEWKNGRRHGRGTEYRKGRVTRTGLWREDVFVSGYARTDAPPEPGKSGNSEEESTAPRRPVK